MFAVGLIKICWASSLDKINNFLIKTTSFHITFQTLQIIVTLNHPCFHWSPSCMPPYDQNYVSSNLCCCIVHTYTHVKYDESIKMFNVTYSWEFSFYSPKGWIHFKQMTWRWQRKELKNVMIMISFVVFWF